VEQLQGRSRGLGKEDVKDVEAVGESAGDEVEDGEGELVDRGVGLPDRALE